MMDIKKYACAGTFESSDVYVEIEPFEKGLDIEIESVVKKQFGNKIEAAFLDVLKENSVKNAKIRLADKGALECVIRARVETAVLRGKEN